MEMVIEYFYGLAEQIAGKSARRYFPWIMTIFLFVIVSNWTGFFPGVGSIGVVQTHCEDHQEEGATEEGMPVCRATGHGRWQPDPAPVTKCRPGRRR